jgi:hypothetical protein
MKAPPAGGASRHFWRWFQLSVRRVAEPRWRITYASATLTRMMPPLNATPCQAGISHAAPSSQKPPRNRTMNTMKSTTSKPFRSSDYPLSLAV